MMWGPVISVVSSVLDRVIPDKNAKEKAAQEIEKALIDNAAQLNLAQAETNKVEASHRSVWVAGWRPCLGWVAALGFAWVFVLQPLVMWMIALSGVEVPLPEFHTDALLELTFAMLGLAGLRTYEKQKGITK